MEYQIAITATAVLTTAAIGILTATYIKFGGNDNAK